MKKFIYCCLSLLLLLSACSDNDDFDSDDKIPEGEGKMEVLSPDDQMKYIGETAGMLIQLLNPEDQKELLMNGAYAMAAYGELKAPVAWRQFAEEFVKAATVTVTGNGSAATPVGGNMTDQEGKTAGGANTKASFNVVQHVYFKDFTGIYTPGSGEWVKAGDSDKIEFLFPGADGQQQSFIITGSEDTFLYSFVSEQWKGSDVYYTSTALYIPTTLEVSYNVHGRSLAQAKLNYTVQSQKNGSYDIAATLSATAANLSSLINITAGNRLLYGDFKVNVGGTTALRGAVAAEGNNLTNVQHIMLLTKLEDVVMQVEEIEGYVDILGRVQINTEMETSRKFVALKKPGNMTLTEADAESKKLTFLLNDKTETWLRFNNTKTKQSEIRWAPYSFEETDGWSYASMPTLYFPKDKVTLTPEELLTVELTEALQDLIDRYKVLFTPSTQNR